MSHHYKCLEKAFKLILENKSLYIFAFSENSNQKVLKTGFLNTLSTMDFVMVEAIKLPPLKNRWCLKYLGVIELFNL